ncbi:MAG: IniB N-terminal domain-containing protein [Kutzneria sp.]|nr:IniB N-terminal domain-containing protein [Kutzneria sp.]
MTTTGFSLLDFILRLLGDPQAQAEFRNDPQQVLQQHGFGGLCAQDVHDALPLVADSVQCTTPTGQGAPVIHHAPPVTVLPGESHLEAAIRQIQYITTNYSYTDSHNTTVDSSVHQNIWADGDVNQSFDNHATTVSGDNDVTGTGNAVGSGNHASSGNEVHNGDGATNFGNGHVDDNSTHATIGGFGSGNVAVTGNGGTTVQTDSHNISTVDSHNTSTVDSHNTDSHNTSIDSHNTTDSNNTHVDSHNATNSNNTHVDSHNATNSNNTSTAVDSHNASSASTVNTHNTDSHDTTVQPHGPVEPHGDHDVDSHDVHGGNIYGDNQTGLINVDHVLSDNNLDLLHGGIHL